MENKDTQWALWEVFVQPKSGKPYEHFGSVHAVDAEQALQNARDLYTRRNEGINIWVVPSDAITASLPEDQSSFFDPANDKIFRHPNFYKISKNVNLDVH